MNRSKFAIPPPRARPWPSPGRRRPCEEDRPVHTEKGTDAVAGLVSPIPRRDTARPGPHLLLPPRPGRAPVKVQQYLMCYSNACDALTRKGIVVVRRTSVSTFYR